MIAVGVLSGIWAGHITLTKRFAHVLLWGFVFGYLSEKVSSKNMIFKLVTML